MIAPPSPSPTRPLRPVRPVCPLCMVAVRTLHPCGLGLALLLVGLLALSACAPASGGRISREIPLPGDTLIPSTKQAKARAERDQAETEATEETTEQDPQQVLREMDARTKRFNQRLQEVMSQAHQDKQVQVVGQHSLPESADNIEPFTIDLFDADLGDVVRLFMSVLEDNYILDPGVGGKVTLHVDDRFTREQLLDLLQGVLRLNGAAMVDQEGVWDILPLSRVPATLSGDQIILPEAGAQRARGQVIQGFKLRYVPATEIVNVLKPYLSDGALLYANDQAGVLVVSDYPHALTKVAKLLELFDVSVFADLNMQVYPLKYAVASDMIKELEALASSMGLSGQSGPAKISFVPLDRLNMVAVLARNRQVLEFMNAWISEMDREVPAIVRDEQEENIFVYYVQNGDATEIVDALEGIFAPEQGATTSPAEPEGPVPVGVQLSEAQAAPPPPPVSRAGAVSGELTGEVTFVVDETTNTIVTRATGSDYKKIREVIRQLDIYPKQVLIEVVIAEVTLDDTTKLGVEWSYLMNLAGNQTATVSMDNALGVVSNASPVITSGLSLIVAGDNLKAALRAFASENRVQILSSPHILASNHKEAKINVGQEVPIVTSELRTNEAASTATTVDKTIQYRDTGIILTVTPHINDKGLVRMEVEQEVSSVAQETVEGVQSPVFSNRVASSTLVVSSEQTVVIGGLIQHTRTENKTGLPGLSKVPLLKYLFGYESDAYKGQELLIFITPHVMESKKDADIISSGFIQRLNIIKQNFQ